MKRILEKNEALHNAGTDPAAWTAIVPVAGRGSRLGVDIPKVLYRVGERTILSLLYDVLTPLVSKIVLVVSPSGRESIAAEIERLDRQDVTEFVVQDKPRGMADAVLCAEAAVRTEHSLVIWGDQVTVLPETLQCCFSCHQFRNGAVLTLPTILKERPYIHFVRDDQDRILQVLQRREGEITVARGENDCGIFCFQTAALFSLLNDARAEGQELGRETKEFNLLPLIPRFEEYPFAGQGPLVLSLRIASEEETIGVNTVEEALQAGEILRRRKQIANG